MERRVDNQVNYETLIMPLSSERYPWLTREHGLFDHYKTMSDTELAEAISRAEEAAIPEILADSPLADTIAWNYRNFRRRDLGCRLSTAEAVEAEAHARAADVCKAGRITMLAYLCELGSAYIEWLLAKDDS